MCRENEFAACRIWKLFNPSYDLEKSERPDWINKEKSIGLEVADARPQSFCKQESFFDENQGKAISEKSKKEFRRAGFFYTLGNDGKLSGIGKVSGEKIKDEVFERIQTKYREAAGYQKLRDLQLFIFARHLCIESFSDSDDKRIFDCAKECEKQHGTHFSKIYICFFEKILVFDLINNSVSTMQYTQEEIEKEIRICRDEYMGIKLGEICKFQSGGTPAKGKAEYFNGNIPWITTTALNGGKIDKSAAVDWITEKAIGESAAKIVPAFSIMVGTRVGVGKVAINTVDMSTSQDIISLIGIDESVWDKDFLCKFLQGKSSYLNSQARGATIKGIKIDVLAALKLPTISLKEQRHISAVIDATKRIIYSRQQELQKLDELIKARFVEMFGDPIINSKHLHTKDLKDVLILKAGDFTAASDISDTQSETNPYPCYGGNGIRGYVAEYNQEGDYSLVGRQGALSGNIQYARGKFKNTEHALLVTPIVEMNSIWLNQLLLNLDLKRYQTGAAQPGLSVKNLQEIPILCVPMDEQNKFAEFVKQLDKSKFVVQQALTKAQTLFDNLMQQYFG